MNFLFLDVQPSKKICPCSDEPIEIEIIIQKEYIHIPISQQYLALGKPFVDVVGE